MASERLTDEQLDELRTRSDGWMIAPFDHGELRWALDDLTTIRRDGHAPPGKVLVDEGELRQRMKELASYRVCSSGRLTPAMREAEVNLLAHFGLAPEARA